LLIYETAPERIDVSHLPTGVYYIHVAKLKKKVSENCFIFYAIIKHLICSYPCKKAFLKNALNSYFKNI